MKLKHFLGLCLVDFSARVSYNMARTPVLPLFAAALGADKATIGLVVGASTVTGIFLKAPAGAISDVLGRARTLFLGAAVFAFTPFVYLLVGYAWTLVAVRFFHGMATAIYGPVMLAAVASVAGARKGEMLSWFAVIKIATGSVGAFLGGGLLYLLGGRDPSLLHFKITYAVCGGFGLVALVIASMVLPRIPAIEPVKKKGGQALRGLWEVVSHFPVVVTSGAEGVQNLTMGALNAFFPIYVVQELGMNPAQAGILWMVLTGTSVVAKPVMGRISDRFGRRWVIASGLILCAVPFALIPTTSRFVYLAMWSIIFGAGEAFVTSATGAMVAELTAERSLGAAMGVFGTIADIGQALGPILTGLLLTKLSYFASFSLLAVLLIVWTVLFLLCTSRPSGAVEVAPPR